MQKNVDLGKPVRGLNVECLDVGGETFGLKKFLPYSNNSLIAIQCYFDLIPLLYLF